MLLLDGEPEELASDPRAAPHGEGVALEEDEVRAVGDECEGHDLRPLHPQLGLRLWKRPPLDHSQ